MTLFLTSLSQCGIQGPALLAPAHLYPHHLAVFPRPYSPDLSACLGETGQGKVYQGREALTLGEN